MFIEVEDLTIQDMGLVYLDMGDKAYLHQFRPFKNEISQKEVQQILKHGKRGITQDKADLKYALTQKLNPGLLKQAVLEGTKQFNFKRYFGGCQVQDMNDEILDNELSKIFMTESERKKLDEVQKMLKKQQNQYGGGGCLRESHLCQPVDFKYSPSEKFLIGQTVGGEKSTRTPSVDSTLQQMTILVDKSPALKKMKKVTKMLPKSKESKKSGEKVEKPIKPTEKKVLTPKLLKKAKTCLQQYKDFRNNQSKTKKQVHIRRRRVNSSHQLQILKRDPQLMNVNKYTPQKIRKRLIEDQNTSICSKYELLEFSTPRDKPKDKPKTHRHHQQTPIKSRSQNQTGNPKNLQENTQQAKSQPKLLTTKSSPQTQQNSQNTPTSQSKPSKLTFGSNLSSKSPKQQVAKELEAIQKQVPRSPKQQVQEELDAIPKQVPRRKYYYEQYHEKRKNRQNKKSQSFDLKTTTTIYTQRLQTTNKTNLLTNSSSQNLLLQKFNEKLAQLELQQKKNIEDLEQIKKNNQIYERVKKRYKSGKKKKNKNKKNVMKNNIPKPQAPRKKNTCKKKKKEKVKHTQKKKNSKKLKIMTSRDGGQDDDFSQNRNLQRKQSPNVRTPETKCTSTTTNLKSNAKISPTAATPPKTTQNISKKRGESNPFLLLAKYRLSPVKMQKYERNFSPLKKQPQQQGHLLIENKRKRLKKKSISYTNLPQTHQVLQQREMSPSKKIQREYREIRNRIVNGLGMNYYQKTKSFYNLSNYSNPPLITTQCNKKYQSKQKPPTTAFQRRKSPLIIQSNRKPPIQSYQIFSSNNNPLKQQQQQQNQQYVKYEKFIY